MAVAMGDALLNLSNDLSLPLEVVTEATAIVATRGAGKSSASAVLVEEAFGLGVQAVVLDRTGVYHGLRSSRRGNGAGLAIYVLGGPNGDAPLETNAGVLIADLIVDTGHSFVLDLSDFSKSAAVRFAADLLERLYDRKARNRSTLLAVIDEAHFYAPQTPRGGFKGDSARLMGAMEDIVGLGRSRGLGVVLTTQRTQALNKAILDLIETLLVMRMLSPRARAAVRDWIHEKHEEDEQGIIPSLDSLPTGEAWVWSPLRGILSRVKIRRIQTFDSYATPKPGETRVEPTARAQLDLDALGDQIRATAERAKENDPGELQRRLAAAEKLARDQAEQIDALARAEVVEREVRVDVVEESTLETLRALVAAGQAAADRMGGYVHDLSAAIDEIGTRLDRVAESGREKAAPRASTPAPRQAERSTPPPTPAREGRTSAPRPDTNGHGDVGTSARRILETLARHHPVRLTPGQVATLSGRKPRGGSWNTAIAELRRAGYLDDDGSTYAATGDGLDAAGVSAGGLSLDDWREALPSTSRDLLDILVEAGPLDAAELAARAGRQARGGSWNTAVATLVRNGLVVRDGGSLRVAEGVRA